MFVLNLPVMLVYQYPLPGRYDTHVPRVEEGGGGEFWRHSPFAHQLLQHGWLGLEQGRHSGQQQI